MSIKKKIPFEKVTGKKVVLMGLADVNFIELSGGTRIYSLTPGRTTLFIVTNEETIVKSQRYEPEYVKK